MRYQLAIANMGYLGFNGERVSDPQLSNAFLLKALPGGEEFCTLKDVSVVDGKDYRLTADMFQLRIIPMPIYWNRNVSPYTGENEYFSVLDREIRHQGFENCLGAHKAAVLDVLRQTMDYRNFHHISNGQPNWKHVPYQVEAIIVVGYEFNMGDGDTPDDYQFSILGEWDRTIQPPLVSQAQLPEEVEA